MSSPFEKSTLDLVEMTDKNANPHLDRRSETEQKAHLKMFKDMFPETFELISVKSDTEIARIINVLSLMNQQAISEGGAHLDPEKWINFYGRTETGKQIIRTYI